MAIKRECKSYKINNHLAIDCISDKGDNYSKYHLDVYVFNEDAIISIEEIRDIKTAEEANRLFKELVAKYK